MKKVLLLALCAGGMMPPAVFGADLTADISANPSAPGSVAAIRTKASTLLKPLPNVMPGGEKDSPARVDLGRKLFFDPILSDTRTLSCNSCHRVDNGKGGVDNEATSLGTAGKRGGRNSPTVLNAGFHLAQFWDGRAPTLEAQAKGPILNPIEMAMPNEAAVLERLQGQADYPALFRQAFPGNDPAITYDHEAEAIAAFERTLVTRDRFDDFLKGDDHALTATEMAGLSLFLKTGCTTCHNGPTIGARSYQKMGLVNPYENTTDVGRFAVTQDEDDKLKFKVPTLRNIALTAPYFHDGTIATLEEAVPKMAKLQLGKDLSEAEVKSLVAFLQTLTDKARSRTAPAKAS